MTKNIEIAKRRAAMFHNMLESMFPGVELANDGPAAVGRIVGGGTADWAIFYKMEPESTSGFHGSVSRMIEGGQMLLIARLYYHRHQVKIPSSSELERYLEALGSFYREEGDYDAASLDEWPSYRAPRGLR